MSLPLAPRDPHQRALMEAAARLGVAIDDRRAEIGEDEVVYRYDGREVQVVRGRVLPCLTPEAEALCDRKDRCKDALGALGVPVPVGIVGEACEPAFARRVEALLAQVSVVVAKPAVGTHGRGVRVGLRNVDAVLAHARGQGPPVDSWIVEAEAPGHDLRVHVIGGALFAACVREPGGVVGDGARTVAELTVARAREVAARNPDNHLALDAQALACLDEQGLGPSDVPAAGRVVPLRKVANMSEGATARDVTDGVDASWRDVCRRIAEELALPVFALDARAPRVGASVEESVVLELNARPEWLHHTFSEGRTHDVAGAMLRFLLPLP